MSPVPTCFFQAMTTKGVMADAKRDVSAWLTKVIYLHETLPELCGQDAPELLGEPNTGSTCASSGFLMSLSALLLRLGSWRFTSTIDEKVLRARAADSVQTYDW